MATATRTTKSFSLEKDILQEVERTKGDASTSERVNRLLRAALEMERRRSLSTEAATFFAADEEEDRTSRLAFQKASLKAISRE